MKTFLLTWNPKKWKWEDYAECVEKVAHGGMDSFWSSGNSKRPVPGDRFFHLRQGAEPRGIIGSGWVRSKPKVRKHHSEPGKTAQYVDIRWDHLLNIQTAAPLGHDVLGKGVLGMVHWSTQASGIEIPPEAAGELEEAWWNHLGRPLPLPPVNFGPVLDFEMSALEGASRRKLVWHRQREWKFREAKIQEALARGQGRLVCEVPRCGFDFAEKYGSLGEGYAHVHHLKPLGARSSASDTDLSELAVVCANCHAMIHAGGECRDLESLIP